MNTLMTKTRINETLYAVTWANVYGEFCGEYFTSELEADNLMINLLIAG